MPLPRIGITLGDPGGIGPEVVRKAIGSPDSLPDANYILYGTEALIDLSQQPLTSLEHVTLKEVESPGIQLHAGKPLAENGQASFSFFKQAAHDALERNLEAVVTAPISKLSWNLAGIPYAGHTEYLEELFPKAIMCFFSSRLNLALYSHHIPLKEALQRIKKKPLGDFFLHLYRQTLPLSQEYHFLVAGLNPHAGEGGVIGKEEVEEIIPAINEARAQGMPISGPIPPDTICRDALDRPDRIVISLYHDQGLIGFKLLSFEEGVNVTLGLPFIRTSPDHGTAFDIAGKDGANAESLLQAIAFACRLCQRK
jgi:4-hydroxythreonine-4-phosphate dehydrogenase